MEQLSTQLYNWEQNTWVCKSWKRGGNIADGYTFYTLLPAWERELNIFALGLEITFLFLISAFCVYRSNLSTFVNGLFIWSLENQSPYSFHVDKSALRVFCCCCCWWCFVFYLDLYYLVSFYTLVNIIRLLSRSQNPFCLVIKDYKGSFGVKN